MITVPEAAKTIIERSRYLSEAISKGLINYSALARYIKPELEEMLIKKVSNASIIMALKRLEPEFEPKFRPYNIFKIIPEISIRSSLYLCSVTDPRLSVQILRDAEPKSFFLENKGLHEISLILSRDIFEKHKEAIAKNGNSYGEHSALTIELPKEALDSSGIYYFFLKSLAWEGINIRELSSTFNELTIIVEDKDTERTLKVIKSLFNTKSR